MLNYAVEIIGSLLIVEINFVLIYFMEVGNYQSYCIVYGGLFFLEVNEFFKKSFKRLKLFNFDVFSETNINNIFIF